MSGRTLIARSFKWSSLIALTCAILLVEVEAIGFRCQMY